MITFNPSIAKQIDDMESQLTALKTLRMDATQAVRTALHSAPVAEADAVALVKWMTDNATQLVDVLKPFAK